MVVLRNTIISVLIAMLALAGCGDIPEQEASSDVYDSELGPFDVPAPDPGPRFFPAPTNADFFNNPDIRAVEPDPEDRLPMVLTEDVYWLPIENAATMVAYGFEELKFPLEGNEAMLGYRPGNILLNRYLMIRHYIEDMRIEGNLIVLQTRLAKIEEVMLYGNLYFEAAPDVVHPEGFDFIDPYLFDSREAQEEAFALKRIEIEEIWLRNERKRQQAYRTMQQASCVDENDWAAEYASGGSRPQFCKDIFNHPADHRGGYEYSLFNCNDDVQEMIDLFRPTRSDPDNASTESHAACDPQFMENGKCPCEYHLSKSDCAMEICASSESNRCNFDVEFCDELGGSFDAPAAPADSSQIKEVMNGGIGGGIGFSISFCMNTRTNKYAGERCPLCPDWTVPFDAMGYPWRGGAPDVVVDCDQAAKDGNGGVCPASSRKVMDPPTRLSDGQPAEKLPTIYQFCDPGVDFGEVISEYEDEVQGIGANLQAGVEAFLDLVDEIRDLIKNWKQLSTSAKVQKVINIVSTLIDVIGYAEDIVNGVKAMINMTTDDGVIPDDRMFLDWWPPMSCDCLPGVPVNGNVWRVNVSLDAYEDGTSGGDLDVGVGLYEKFPIQLGPDIFNLTISPIFMLTAGMKVRFKVKWLSANLTIGFYVGIGYGINIALKVEQLNELVGSRKRIYYSQRFGNGKGLINFNIWIVPFTIDPYFRTEFSAEATISGRAEYEYYNEHWMYFCLKIGTSGVSMKSGAGGTGSGNQARDDCGLPKALDDAYVNEWLESGMALQAQATALLGIGLELRLGRGIMPVGNGIYYEPMQIIAHIGITLRRPYCYWEAFLKFGWELGVRLDLPVIGKVEPSPIGGLYPFGPLFFEGTIEGWLFRSLFGCGDFPEIEPYGGDKDDCPIGEAGDIECTERISEDSPGTEARCFARQCITHDDMRVSLAWTTANVDLNLNVRRRGAGQTHYVNNGNTAPNGSPQNGQFTRWSNGTETDAGGRYIENFIMRDPAHGDYEFWVTVEPGTASPGQEIPFTIEVERDDPLAPVREIFEGSTYAEHSTPAKQVTMFDLCLPQSDDEFCSDNCSCGTTSGYDNCGNYRENVDCGHCFFPQGDSNPVDIPGYADCIRLTENENNKRGCAWHRLQVDFSQEFNHTFHVNVGSDPNGADGLSVVYQTVNGSVCGGAGGGIGAQGLASSWIIEFDTYYNSDRPDLQTPHTAISVNGNITSHLSGPVNLGNIVNGNFDEVKTHWDPTTKRFRVWFNDSLVHDVSHDIVANVFGGNPIAYWGATASTGGSRNEHTVCFSDDSEGSRPLLNACE